MNDPAPRPLTASDLYPEADFMRKALDRGLILWSEGKRGLDLQRVYDQTLAGAFTTMLNTVSMHVAVFTQFREFCQSREDNDFIKNSLDGLQQAHFLHFKSSFDGQSCIEVGRIFLADPKKYLANPEKRYAAIIDAPRPVGETKPSGHIY
jgi:hypothetical protein